VRPLKRFIVEIISEFTSLFVAILSEGLTAILPSRHFIYSPLSGKSCRRSCDTFCLRFPYFSASRRGKNNYNMIGWQRFLLFVAVPALIHGVPEAKALQRSSRLPRPQRNVVQQSSHPLPFPPMQRSFKSTLRSTTAIPIPSKEQQDQSQRVQKFQDVRERSGVCIKNNTPFQHLLKSVPVDRLVWSVKSLVFLGAVYSLTKTGRLSSLSRFIISCLQNAFFAYQSALISRPLRTKVATGATLALLGDALAQSTTSTPGTSYNKRRAASFAAFDSCYRVFQHFMFPAVIRLCQGNILNKVLPSVLEPVAAAVERTLLYQLVIVPVSLSSATVGLVGWLRCALS
jgi:hypothetical protein